MQVKVGGEIVSNSGMQKGVQAKSDLVRAAHPHENVPKGVEVSSNPSPIVLSKRAHSSDPCGGQELRISLNDSPLQT